MLKNLITLSFLLFIYASPSLAQTIANKEFSKANTPVYLLDGFANFSAAGRNQASAFEHTRLPNSTSNNLTKNAVAIGNDTQVFFKTGVRDKAKNKYGVIAKAEFHFNSDGRDAYPVLDQAFWFGENKHKGRLEVGNITAVNQKMKSGPAKFARGAGGINGKYLESVNLPTSNSANANIKSPRFILLAQSPIGHGGYARGFNNLSLNDNTSFNRGNFRSLKDNSFDGVEDATKMNYYTPRIAGLKLGVSYTPNSNDSGLTSTKYYNLDDAELHNIFSLGVNYLEYFDNLRVEVSATAERGKVQNSRSQSGIQRRDLSSYDLGFSLSYFGFDLGASYGSWNKSLSAKNGLYACDYDAGSSLASQDCSANANRFSDPYYYTAGIAYSFGPIAASLTSLTSEFEANKYDAISFGLDYKLSKSLMPYFEVTKFELESNQPQASDLTNQVVFDNQGYVFLTGILIAF